LLSTIVTFQTETLYFAIATGLMSWFALWLAEQVAVAIHSNQNRK
jgi:hypothetical protein